MNDQLNETRIDPATGLTYRLRPAQAGQGATPCLVLLHGVGSNESGFIDLARQVDPQLNVVLVRGPLALGPDQFAFFQVNFSANGPAINPAQAERARTTLIDFIGQLPQLHGIDPARIWIAGFSQGGIMSAGVALTAPAKVAGFGILSGRILPEVLPLVKADPLLAALPAFVSHGVQDNVLGIHFAHHAKQVLDGFNVPLTYREYQGGHSLNGAMAGDFLGWLGTQLDATRTTAQ
ncbi:alpha/beta hydrolase [Massilia sp. HP4]|uniref:alpha/beta hydrolase n=1 Tax=Massilia sp. HP4 TaxID=2562316 RepID=UPI0010C0F5C7|nr:PHB depolymerase family esterase [Massilia sp. HP4]